MDVVKLKLCGQGLDLRLLSLKSEHLLNLTYLRPLQNWHVNTAPTDIKIYLLLSSYLKLKRICTCNYQKNNSSLDKQFIKKNWKNCRRSCPSASTSPSKPRGLLIPHWITYQYVKCYEAVLATLILQLQFL